MTELKYVEVMLTSREESGIKNRDQGLDCLSFVPDLL